MNTIVFVKWWVFSSSGILSNSCWSSYCKNVLLNLENIFKKWPWNRKQLVNLLVIPDVWLGVDEINEQFLKTYFYSQVSSALVSWLLQVMVLQKCDICKFIWSVFAVYLFCIKFLPSCLTVQNLLRCPDLHIFCFEKLRIETAAKHIYDITKLSKLCHSDRSHALPPTIKKIKWPTVLKINFEK